MDGEREDRMKKRRNISEQGLDGGWIEVKEETF